jgi:hypothetical protein
LKWVLLASVLFLITLGLWAAWRWHAGRTLTLIQAIPLPLAIGATPLKTSLPAVSATPLELAAVTRTPFPMTFSSPAPNPGLSLTPNTVENCGYVLETRIELDGRVLILHKVRRGESIEVLATNYETSLQAMQAVNYFLPSPLWAELVIVIPVGSLEGDDTRILEPYQVLEPGMSIAALAEQLSVSPEELTGVNALDVDCPVISGWVLVPRQAYRNP